MQGVSKEDLKQLMNIFVTYDPMNLGVPVDYQVQGSAKEMRLKFSPKYGAHVRLAFKGGDRVKPFMVKEVSVLLADKELRKDFATLYGPYASGGRTCRKPVVCDDAGR